MSKVYLVGAGPGDPELLTLKGQRVLSMANAVFYDHLANPLLLRWARSDAERVYVGKKRSSHAFTQDEIIAMMVDRARRDLTVVRLKGGDPYIFGRGGEEVEGLVKAGIGFEVVPGVTAPLGIAAYTGVPLTHREHTSVVTFVTGHELDAIDWTRTGLTGTVVVFMGLQHLDLLARRMIAAGRSADTPAMAVRWGTRPDQRTVSATLGTLAQLADDAGLLPPVTVFIGEVVGLRDRLDWFGKRPLSGQKIIVTRSSDQGWELWFSLNDLGAEVVELPVIQLAPLDDYTVLDGCVAGLAGYDWTVFTSTNAVTFFMQRLQTLSRDVRAMRGSVCAIGEATANRLRDYGVRADLVPSDATSEGIAVAFKEIGMNGKKVLLPRAEIAREVIPEQLQQMGALVDVADTYRNVIPSGAAGQIHTYLSSGRHTNWITFTSGSTVKNWLTLAGSESLNEVRIASIGPTTSDVIRMHGLQVHAEAQPHTVSGLVEAILRAGR